ncbi:hypothetical protein PG995_009144 [Apiospora arundinis]
MHVFLHEFSASGLVNDYAHIRGDVVINHLFCSGKQHTISHHKAIKNADSALHALGQWMDGGGRGRSETESQKKVPSGRGTTFWRPILAHRHAHGPKLQPRDSLAVSEGFWEGIDQRVPADADPVHRADSPARQRYGWRNIASAPSRAAAADSSFTVV